MQDPSFYSQFKAQVQPQNPQFADNERLKCPRCDSTDTKFCYYNNYNLSQPRYFCKSCRRYWTKGGALRNVPVGGGSRKSSKRSSAAAGSAAKRPASASEADVPSDGKSKGGGGGEAIGPEASSSLGSKGYDNGNSFAGLFGNLTEEGGGFNEGNGGPGSGQNVVDPLALDDCGGHNDRGVGFLNVDGGGRGGGSWSGDSNEWTGLAMYTPGPSFHHKYASR